MTEREFQQFMNDVVTAGYTKECIRIRKMPRRAQRRIDAERHLDARFLSAHQEKDRSRLDALLSNALMPAVGL